MNRKLHVSEDVTIDQLFSDYKSEIYVNVLESIKENYKKSEIKEIKVVKISTKSEEYSIDLARDKFTTVLKRCISHFESLEDYEKCQECMDIIKDIKNTNNLYDIRSN